MKDALNQKHKELQDRIPTIRKINVVQENVHFRK